MSISPFHCIFNFSMDEVREFRELEKNHAVETQFHLFRRLQASKSVTTELYQSLRLRTAVHLNRPLKRIQVKQINSYINFLQDSFARAEASAIKQIASLITLRQEIFPLECNVLDPDDLQFLNGCDMILPSSGSIDFIPIFHILLVSKRGIF